MKPYSLVGVDGNAYAVMGYTQRAMRHAGYSKDEIHQMIEEAESSDYNNLLCVCMEYIDKVNEKLDLTDEDEEDEYYG